MLNLKAYTGPLLAQWLGKKEGSVLESFIPYTTWMLTSSFSLSLSLRPLGIMAFSSIIRLSPMVCQSVQEDCTHYPNCSTLLSTQKSRFHLVIWARQEAAERYGSSAATIADIHILYLLITQADLECTVGRGNVPGDILGTSIASTAASIVLRLEGFGIQLSQKQIGFYNNGVLNRVDA